MVTRKRYLLVDDGPSLTVSTASQQTGEFLFSSAEHKGWMAGWIFIEY
jgi:hypothetical protein